MPRILIPLLIATALITGGAIYATRQASRAPDSTPGPSPTPTPIDCSGPGGQCGAGYTCIQRCGPPVAREDDPPPGYYCELDAIAAQPRMCPICLASNAGISTPEGDTNVKDVDVGMRVWSMSAQGEKIAGTVVSVSHTPTPRTHEVTHLVLSDGREVWVSPNHPTASGLPVGSLQAGESFDGAIVRSADLVPYWDDATYDLLVDSDTGRYWANGILLGSTLFSPE